jgi:hypothetical protein
MTTNDIILFFINIIHILVIIFVVIVPFTNNNFLLLMHSIIIPFIMLHWMLNNDTCAITMMEKYVRIQMNGGTYIDDKDCISHKIIGPVYNFMNEHIDYSRWTWIMTSILWFVTLYKIRNKYENNELDEFKNIFIK